MVDMIDKVYTYAIDRVTGVTYVGKSEVQLELFNDASMCRPKHIRLSECEVFETLDIIRLSKSLGNSSYGATLKRVYHEMRDPDQTKKEGEKIGIQQSPTNRVEVCLENVVWQTLESCKK